MGGYAPNPIALEATKVASYWIFGRVVSRWAARPRSPALFAALRAAAGVAVGIGCLATFMQWARLDDRQAYLLFQVPRLLVWAAALHFWFRPRGGLAALAVWSGLGTLLSILVDLAFLGLAQLHVPGATWTIC